MAKIAFFDRFYPVFEENQPICTPLIRMHPLDFFLSYAPGPMASCQKSENALILKKPKFDHEPVE